MISGSAHLGEGRFGFDGTQALAIDRQPVPSSIFIPATDGANQSITDNNSALPILRAPRADGREQRNRSKGTGNIIYETCHVKIAKTRTCSALAYHRANQWKPRNSLTLPEIVESAREQAPKMSDEEITARGIQWKSRDQDRHANIITRLQTSCRGKQEYGWTRHTESRFRVRTAESHWQLKT